MAATHSIHFDINVNRSGAKPACMQCGGVDGNRQRAPCNIILPSTWMKPDVSSAPVYDCIFEKNDALHDAFSRIYNIERTPIVRNRDEFFDMKHFVYVSDNNKNLPRKAGIGNGVRIRIH